jgi:hypothetical protein
MQSKSALHALGSAFAKPSEIRSPSRARPGRHVPAQILRWHAAQVFHALRCYEGPRRRRDRAEQLLYTFFCADDHQSIVPALVARVLEAVRDVRHERAFVERCRGGLRWL